MNDYFARLMEAEGLVASLDPPSSRVNSAKLERHAGHCDAMVVVLTERESGASPHILYEISVGLRARKPVLAFIEDTPPPGIVPTHVLQRRFHFAHFHEMCVNIGRAWPLFAIILARRPHAIKECSRRGPAFCLEPPRWKLN